jgi:flagellin-like protein
MLNLLQSKKAVSPLVATILLLAVAIVVGVLVMNWGRAQLEEASQCTIKVGLSFVELNQKPQICYSGSGPQGALTFIVENGAASDVESLHLRIIGTKNVYNMNIDDSYIEKGYSLMKTIPYDFTLFGNIRQIRLVPYIKILPEEEPLLCVEQSLSIEEVAPC